MKFLNILFNNFEGWVSSRGVFKDRFKVYMEGNLKFCIYICRKIRTYSKFLKVSIIMCVVGLIVMCVMSFLIWKSKEKKFFMFMLLLLFLFFKELFMNVLYDEFSSVIENFNFTDIFGVGSFGSVFKGVMRGVDVAVKVIDFKVNGYYKGFMAECEVLSNVSYSNFVKLVIFCLSMDFKNNEFLVLVYEFLSNGSLEEWIKGKYSKFDGSVGLNFEESVNVVIDIVFVLDYLYNDCEVYVVYCDLKFSNIFLIEDMVVKVGDFGLVRVLFDVFDDRYYVFMSFMYVLKGFIGYIFLG